MKTDKFIAWRYLYNVLAYFVAQKVVDNVLDIKDDEDGERTVGDGTKMVKSRTLPSLLEIKKEQDDSVWGSFNGSFFDSNAAPSMPITNAPPRNSDTSTGKLIWLFIALCFIFFF